MRVTTLIENDVIDGRNDLTAEFGLSVVVEIGATTILFDTGASGAFADNAVAMGVDLDEVDLAVLSHHHFDHGGGLARFLELNPTAPIFLRDGPLTPRWFKALAIVKRPIGLDLDVIEAARDRFRFVGEDTEIAPGIWLLTEISTAQPRPTGNRHLFVEHDGRLEPDPFDHELVMVVHEGDGVAVFTGCSHSGILNMVETAAERFPDTPIKAVLGGFHLIGLPLFDTMTASRPEVEALARAMLDRVAGPVFTGHCTGDKGYETLSTVMGDRLRPIHTGTTVTL
ncbi:MAG: MBL fold metallo-hydrolase [Holophagae bacterium]|jgi:7,8-dihydropterin-6-yl-methyl-4-(beta-D-ribofuranosyl)aminobenzene 5'-phosphate synthase